MLVLKSMAANGGEVEAAALGKATADFGAAYDGRLNHMVKQFMEAVSAGKDLREAASPDNVQAHALTKVPLVVARYAGDPRMIDKVKQQRSLLLSLIQARRAR
jgi:hypothetical protein